MYLVISTKLVVYDKETACSEQTDEIPAISGRQRYENPCVIQLKQQHFGILPSLVGRGGVGLVSGVTGEGTPELSSVSR